MKKTKKNKKEAVPSEIAVIPAYDRFCNLMYDSEQPYKWQSWGLVLRHLRDYAGMDQAIFGRLLQGYTRGQISRYETEETEPPVVFWGKIMRTFGLNINWALTGEGQPYVCECQDCAERKRFYEWDRLVHEKENFLRELRGR